MMSLKPAVAHNDSSMAVTCFFWMALSGIEMIWFNNNEPPLAWTPYK